MFKKKITNILFVVMLVVIVGLAAVFFYMLHLQDRYVDLSYKYKPDVNMDGRTSADTFAEDLVKSDANVSLEGFQLTSSSEKGLLFNIDSNEPVFAQGIYDRAYPASITKIMTAILTMKYGNMSDVVVMEESDFDLEEGAQVSGMIPGDTLTMQQLFECMVVYSANDAAMAIARHISGSVDNFVALMNEEAKSLGMTGTHFTNPHGLHNDDHYTCAYDVYLMLNEAIKYTQFTDTIGMNMYNLTVTRADGSQISYRLDSTDKYLTGQKELPPDVALWGGKTGTTPEAGSCLSLVMQNKNGVPFISVILGADNSNILYSDMTNLISHINS
jgi:D-alanyl-D-alanine carboxypeptidase